MVQNRRRHSSVRVAISRDRATSPCSLSSLHPDATDGEQSLVTSTAVDVLDVAVNTSDPPSEADYESSEERWTSPFPKKVSKDPNSVHQNEARDSFFHTDPSSKSELEFEVCDISYET